MICNRRPDQRRIRDVLMVSDDSSLITRRAALAGAGAAVLSAPFWDIGGARAAALPPSMVLPFSVRRDGGEFGYHRLSFRQDGSRLTVGVDILLEVKIAFVTVYRYRHTNTEIWENGRLTSLESRTDNDGTPYQVSAVASGDSVLIDGSQGRVTAPADILTTSYWNKEILQRDVLLDTQRGRLIPARFTPETAESVAAGGQTVPAQRYSMSGPVELDIWFSDVGQWVKMRFVARGSEIDYVLEPGNTVARTG